MITSLFGDRKFGTFKFGKTTQTRSRFGFEVDWDGNGLFSGENEASRLQELTIERGRKYTISADGQSFLPEETGKLSTVLLDNDRRYDPFNNSSPLYGFIGGGKYFRLTVRTPGDLYLPLMAGTLDEPVNYSERSLNKARLEGSDGWEFLRNQKNEVTIPLQENIYADDAIALILDKAGWPRMWGSNLADGVDMRPYFWVENRSAAQVIHDLAHNELGTVCITANGNMKFSSRLNLEEESAVLTDTDVLRDGFHRMSPAEVIRNVIKVISNTRTEAALQTVWEIPTAQRIGIEAGETVDDIFAEFTYNNESVPVKNPLTPVLGTDYNATQNEDGSGADYSGNISISMYPFSTKAQLVAKNNGASKAWLYAKVRGIPVIKSNSVSFLYRDQDSIKLFGPRPFILEVDQNINIARQYKDLLASYMTIAKNYLVVDLVPNPELQFGFDLGQIIRGSFSKLGINQTYRVIRLRHQWRDAVGIATSTRLWLEPYTRLFTGVQLPVQIPFQLGGS